MRAQVEPKCKLHTVQLIRFALRARAQNSSTLLASTKYKAGTRRKRDLLDFQACPNMAESRDINSQTTNTPPDYELVNWTSEMWIIISNDLRLSHRVPPDCFDGRLFDVNTDKGRWLDDRLVGRSYFPKTCPLHQWIYMLSSG